MTVDPQWWEYHLTPQGWTEGSRKANGASVTVQTPIDRVLTGEWREGNWTETWKSLDEERCHDLIQQFGEKPKSPVVS